METHLNSRPLWRERRKPDRVVRPTETTSHTAPNSSWKIIGGRSDDVLSVGTDDNDVNVRSKGLPDQRNRADQTRNAQSVVVGGGVGRHNLPLARLDPFNRNQVFAWLVEQKSDQTVRPLGALGNRGAAS